MHLQLHGATVSPSTQVINWALEQHTFLPIPIGDSEAPMQVVPLRNGGPAPVEYTLDTSVLDRLTAANYDVEILRLVSPPQGVIPPGRTALLNFILQPVEVKEVVVDMPIQFSNGKVRQCVCQIVVFMCNDVGANVVTGDNTVSRRQRLPS